MLNKRQLTSKQTVSYQCGTIKQHFNHLRNNSQKMRSILTWGDQEQQQHVHDSACQHRLEINNTQKNHENVDLMQKKNVTFSMDPKQKQNTSLNKTNNTTTDTKNKLINQNTKVSEQQRPKSIAQKPKKSKQEDEAIQIRNRIRERQLQEEVARKVERRQKVVKYIEDLGPYTRTLTNTKYQDYFDKAALQSYGRANTKNAIGGIIYGNHLKTFNLNPHTKGNQPKHYQTHKTAINYGKRTKLNDEDKWNRLQKQLSKKLGLKDKNQTLKEGKQVVYVDVDEDNMYSVMKQNLEFKKAHEEEIRNQQKDYKKQIQNEKKAAIEQFYANKRDRIISGNTIDSQNSSYVCPRDEKGRLHEQIIFKTTDKHGNVKLGADRHALTCFVDMNFPQNDAAYTQQLKDRLQIYPIQVQDKDKYIDDRRKGNYEKSLENIYPSHYLLPNCDQPQVIKMINNKYGKLTGKRQAEIYTKNLSSTVGTIPNLNKTEILDH